MTSLSMIRTLIAAWTVLCALALTGMATAQQAPYRIKPGDTLRIEVLEDTSLNRSVLVSPDGRITLPLAGSVQASGRPVEAVQADLAARLTPNFASAPSVFVSLQQLAAPDPVIPRTVLPPAPDPTIDVFVMGEVANPGRLTVPPGTTVLQIFAQMGGFTNFAAEKRVQLRRIDSSGSEKVYSLNYKAIEAGTSRNGTVSLMDGDVIVVPQRRLFE